VTDVSMRSRSVRDELTWVITHVYTQAMPGRFN
jgi:hypothetical protein